MKSPHRTCLIPSASRKGSIKFNMLVNCENMIVFSAPSERLSISFKISNIFLIFAESGGRWECFGLGQDTAANEIHSLQ